MSVRLAQDNSEAVEGETELTKVVVTKPEEIEKMMLDFMMNVIFERSQRCLMSIYLYDLRVNSWR